MTLSVSSGMDRQFAASIWNIMRTAPKTERWSRSWSSYTLVKCCELNRVTL